MANLTDTKHINPAYFRIARPYALAAFDYARDKHQLAEWRTCLSTIAHEVVATPAGQRLLGNPEVPHAAWLDLFKEILGSLLTPERQRFLSSLVQNKRLVILPEIAALFADYQAALEKSSHVRVITAVSLDEEMKHALARALAKRSQNEVTLQCEVDPSILGGAVIHIHDKVIDGSIRSKLTRLLEFSLR